MKRIALFPLVILVLAACQDIPTDTATQSGQLLAAETFSHHAGSASARAEFSKVDGAGVQTDVEISVGTGFNPAGGGGHAGPPESQTGMGISILQFESACPPSVAGCPSPLLRVNTSLIFPDASSFHFPAISRGARATLNATVNVLDRSSNSLFDVLIDLTWVCTGEVEHEATHHAFGSPGEDVDVQSIQFVRCAASATGVVSDGVTDFIGGPSQSAEMRSENLVEVEVSTGN